MAKGSCRKRCVDCRRTWNAARGVLQWCDDCGGELVEVPYRAKNRRKARK